MFVESLTQSASHAGPEVLCIFSFCCVTLVLRVDVVLPGHVQTLKEIQEEEERARRSEARQQHTHQPQQPEHAPSGFSLRYPAALYLRELCSSPVGVTLGEQSHLIVMHHRSSHHLLAIGTDHCMQT